MPKYTVDEEIYDIPEEKVDSFLLAFPNAILVEETEDISIEDDSVSLSNDSANSFYKSLDVETPDLDFEAVETSKPKESDKDWEEFNWWDDTTTQFWSTVKRLEAGASRIPTMINELSFSAARGIDQLMLEEEEYEEKYKEFDALDPSKQQFILNQIGETAGRMTGGNIISSLAQKGLDNSKVALKESEKLQGELTVFDDTIGQAISKGNIGEATARATSAAVGSIPFMLEAMIPYIGIPMIFAQEASLASEEAQKRGEDIDLKTMGYSTVIGASEALLEVVTKRIGKGVFKELFGKSNEIIKRSTKEIGMQFAKRSGAEGLSESGTLTINSMADAVMFGDEKSFDEYFLELVDTFIIGATSGGGMSAPGSGFSIVRNAAGARKVNKQLKESKYTNLIDAYKDTNVNEGLIKLSENSFTQSFLNYDLNKNVREGLMTTNQADIIKKNFRDIQGSTNRVKNLDLTDTQKVEAIEKLNRLDVLEESVKQVNNKALSTPQVEEINRLNEELASLVLEKDIKFTEDAAQKLGIEVQVLDTNTKPEDQKIIDEVFVDEKGKKVSGVEGAYDPKTNKIYIDKVEAAKKQKVTVGSHELLHGILANAAKIDNKILDQFKAQMSKDQVDLINNKLKENYSKEYIEQNPDEFITQFSDAIALGEITYNDSLFTKLMDVITPILRAVGFSNIKFDTGKDVYNFMREYSKSIKEGKLSKDILSATQTRQAEGAKKFSKAETIDALVGPKTDGKYTISKTEWDNKSDQVIGDLYEGLQGLIKSKIPSEKPPGFSQEDFISGTIAELIPHIRNFNPEQNNSLSGWINSQLQNKIGNVFKKGEAATKDVFEADVTEAKSVAVEDTPTPAQEKSIRSKLRRDLKIDKDLIDKVKQAVRKTFGTKLPEIESKEFKQALQKAYRTELKTPLAELLGTRENYKKFLEDNFESIYKALPQDILNKRFRQFAEDTGQREKTPEGKKIFKKRSIDKQEFVDYFLGPDVGTSTKGTRKDALAETLGEIMALDATMEVIKEPEVKAKREAVAKLKDQKVTKTDEAKIGKQIDRDPGLKFSKRLDEENVFKNVTQDDSKDFSNEKIVWKNYVKKLGQQPLDPKNENDVKDFKKWFAENIPNYFPKSIITTGTFANAGDSAAKRGFFFTSKEDIMKIVKGKKFQKENFNIAQAAQRQGYTTGTGKDRKITPSFLKNLWQTNKLEKQNKAKLKGLEDVFIIFEKMIQDNKNNARFIASILSSTSQGMGHIVRTSAPITFISKNLKGEIVEEHTLPASLVAKYLFKSAIQGKVKENFKNIERNYFQGVLSKIDDNKLKGTAFGEKYNYTQVPPKGWTLEDNIWARYFNLDVASNNFGIDPNSIELNNKKTVFDIYGVDNAGNFIDDAFNKSLKQAAVKNNKELPVKIKFSKGNIFNNRVLSEMKKLDNEQSKAQMKFSQSQDLSGDFNKILENKTGIGADKVYSDVKAQVVGANKGKFNFFVPPSAEDFVGLLYKTLGKGKLGDAQMAWYKKNLLDPFARAMDNISRDRIALMNDFKALKKELKIVPKNLKKKLPGEPFTQEQAIRTYIWNKQGMTPDGMSKADLKELTDFVESKPELVTFADQLIALQKGDSYPAPKFGWLAGNITTDLIDGINTIKRAKYLDQWQYNVDEIFSKANLNKLEAAYGKGYRTALEGMLKRMRTGRNREFTSDSLTGRVTDWLTNSIGAIMFFNTRSAVLQTISAVNFVNFKDNNIFAAGKAFANQPQFWKDFKTLFNSDFLVDRRNGLKLNVNEADIADMAKKGGVRGVISEMLRLGFLPTQIADSFAIASGGSTFYRNRIKKYTKEGMSKAEAEDKAFIDFREIAEEAQQSSRPDRISAQQAGPLGRIILAFANTPMQYTRLIKKAASDLKNGRGDTMTNISKIFYYGIAQNLLFNAMQQALFAMGFGDDEEETEKREEKYANIVNSMADSILRGAGIGGAIFSVLKNTGIKLSKEADKKSPKYQDVLTKEIAQLSPPVSSKLSKLRAAGRSYSWNKKEIMEKGFSLDNPAYLAAGQVIAATTNIPLDRAFKKIDNIRKASSSDYEAWARIAMLAGWADWEIGVKKEKPKKVKKPKKTSYKRNYKKQYKKRKYK